MNEIKKALQPVEEEIPSDFANFFGREGGYINKHSGEDTPHSSSEEKKADFN